MLTTETPLYYHEVTDFFNIVIQLANKYQTVHELDLSEIDTMLNEFEGKIVPTELIIRLNEAFLHTRRKMEMHYVRTKQECIRLQDMIKKLLDIFGASLPPNYPPAYFSDMDMMADVFYHRSYLEEYLLNLQHFKILMELRAQYAKPDTTIETKGNVIVFSPREPMH